MDPEELAAALVRLTEWAEERAPEPEPPVRRRLREHLGRDPAAQLERALQELRQGAGDLTNALLGAPALGSDAAP